MSRSLTSPCRRAGRIGEPAELQTAIAAWSDKTKDMQRAVDGQVRIEDALTKLKGLYSPNPI